MDDPAKIKRDYFVPHFGTDNEINGIADSLKAAEGSLGHKLEVKGYDGEGSYTLLQTNSDVKAESDPICSSAGCTQYEHPTKALGYKINYFVPHFGEDSDMIASRTSASIAEK